MIFVIFLIIMCVLALFIAIIILFIYSIISGDNLVKIPWRGSRYEIAIGDPSINGIEKKFKVFCGGLIKTKNDKTYNLVDIITNPYTPEPKRSTIMAILYHYKDWSELSPVRVGRLLVSHKSSINFVIRLLDYVITRGIKLGDEVIKKSEERWMNAEIPIQERHALNSLMKKIKRRDQEDMVDH